MSHVVTRGIVVEVRADDLLLATTVFANFVEKEQERNSQYYRHWEAALRRLNEALEEVTVPDDDVQQGTGGRSGSQVHTT